jgi:uncharacterized membrane protein
VSSSSITEIVSEERRRKMNVRASRALLKMVKISTFCLMGSIKWGSKIAVAFFFDS